MKYCSHKIGNLSCQVGYKVKVNLSLCFNWAPSLKAYFGSEGITPRILDLGNKWKSVISFTSRTTRKRAPRTHWIGGWVGPRAGLDVVVKRKTPSTCWDSNPPIIQPVAQRYTTELSQLLFYRWYSSIFTLLSAKSPDSLVLFTILASRSVTQRKQLW
jgi:hypothetical protein